MIKMVYYYEFNDGYFCFTAGKMSKSDILCEVLKHGKLCIERKSKTPGTYYSVTAKRTIF